MKIRILFIRHAQSQANTKPHIIAGKQPNTPLTPLGQEQALKLRKTLQSYPTPNIFTSDLLRARETARIAVGEQKYQNAVLVPELQEFTNGDWDGASRKKIHTIEQLGKINTAGYLFTPPNGESQRMVQRRASNWLEDNVLYNNQFHTPHEQVIFIFSHGIVIKTLLHYILGFSDRFIYRFALENTGICEFLYTEEGWFPISINDTKHL